VSAIPGALCGRGPDAHLPWQAMVAIRSEGDAKRTNVKKAASRGDDKDGTSPASPGRGQHKKDGDNG
jgi:hypothetical protein